MKYPLLLLLVVLIIPCAFAGDACLEMRAVVEKDGVAGESFQLGEEKIFLVPVLRAGTH